MRSVLALLDDARLRAELAQALAALEQDVTFDATDAGAGGDANVRPTDFDVVVIDFSPSRALDVRADPLARDGVPLICIVDALDHDVLYASAMLAPAAYVVKPVQARELAAALAVAQHRLHAEKRGGARERSLQTTLRSIGDAVITADDNSMITFINPTAAALTGWGEEEALRRPLDEVFHVETADADAPSSEDGRPVLRLITRDGTALHVEHNAAPIVEESGALHGVVVVFRDITERRRIEQRLALSGRMTSIGTLAAGIAHELNNPLAFVTSNLDFVIGELESLKGDKRAAFADAELEDSLAALREAADGAGRAAQIVKDMKVFIRGEAEARTKVDINRVLSFAARLTNNEVRHAGELELSLGQVPSTLADEGKLVQVFVNLLTNAAQAHDPKKAAHSIRVTTGVERGRVVVRVSDDGKGIAAEHLGRVFEPFFTTRPVGQGLGLGLSIAHSILTTFGGTIGIESTLGAGTTVTVSLPASEDANDTLPQQQPAGPKRVMVIDDEALIGTAVRRILVKQGFEVVAESDGRLVLDRVASGEQYDVILCDLMMPGFSGVDFFESLQQQAPQQLSRVVLMTGNAFTPRARELFESTSNVRLDKPFLPADLIAAVQEVLRRQSA